MIITFNARRIFAAATAAIAGIAIGVLITAAISSGGALPTSGEAESADSDGIPIVIVMYHNFSKSASKCGTYTVTPQLFEQDILYLKSHGYEFVTCDDLADYADCRKDLPDKCAMITIDDGYYNNYVYIYPILKEQNVKATISPIAIESDNYTESGDMNPNYANLCWDNIREMAESGLVSFQNHTYNLHKMMNGRRGCAKMRSESAAEYQSRLKADLGRANEKIAAATGKSPICMVYPFGAASAEARPVLDELGLRMSLSCTEGISRITRDPESLYMLKRNNRPYGISSENFFARLGIVK